jgi:hypothetical protein
LGGDFNNLEMAEKGPIDARFMLQKKSYSMASNDPQE